MNDVFVVLMIFGFGTSAVTAVVSERLYKRAVSLFILFLCGLMLLGASLENVTRPFDKILHECEKVLVETNAPRNLKCQLTYEIVEGEIK